jgi:predicted amino acid racemase
MKNILFILFTFIFLTGCAQNLALLGPAFSVVKTGGIQHAIVGETINYGVKNKTGKNVSEHAMSLLPEGEILDCDNTYSNGLQKIFFEKSEDPDCKEIQ